MTDDLSTLESSDIIRKIGLLLATAESFAEQGNQEAADSYISKAHQLQQKYSIDQAMLADRGQRAKSVVIVKTIDLPGSWGRRKVSLAHRVGNTMDCMGYFSHRYPLVEKSRKDADGNVQTYMSSLWDAPKIYTWTAFGFAEDVEWLESLVTHLCHQADLFLAIAQKERPPYEHHRTFGANFMDGFTDDVVRRLREARRLARKEAEDRQRKENESRHATHGEGDSNDTGHSVALVLASKKKQVEEEYKARYSGGGRKSYTSETFSSSGYSAGRAAGSKANLARGSVNPDSRGRLGK